MNVNTLTGASVLLNTAANALPVDGHWLIARHDDGAISGQMNYQFSHSVLVLTRFNCLNFDGTGDFGGGGGTTAQGCTGYGLQLRRSLIPTMVHALTRQIPF